MYVFKHQNNTRTPKLSREFFCGGAAAITASCVTHPIDVVKLRMFLTGELQASVLPRLAMVRDMYAAHGVRGFYAGLSATVLRQALFSTTRFGVFAAIQKKQKQHPGASSSAAASILATTTAGGLAAIVGCPADVALVRMQSQTPRRNYKNVMHALSSIVKQEGVFALYRGVHPLVARGMLVTTGQFMTYAAIKQRLAPNSPASHAVSGLAAGFVAAVLSTPADVIKSRMMNHYNITYASSTDCLKRTLKTEGVRGLYKGFVPAFARMAPQVTIMWVAYEQYMRLF